MKRPSQVQIDSAYSHLMAGVARNDALPADHAARNALGDQATESAIADWIRRWRPEAAEAA